MIKQKQDFKIALIGDSLSAGGAEKVHALLSNFFVANGYNVSNCVLVGSVTYQYSGSILNLSNITLGSNSIFNKLKKYLILRKFIKQNQFDVIIDFRMRNVFFRDYLLSKFVFTQKTYYTVHSGILDYYFPKSRILSKLIYTDKNLIAVSKAIENKILFEKELKNVAQISNPIDFEEVLKLKEEFIPKVQNYILAVGRMNNDIKQFDKLIIAYSKSELPKKNIDLVFLGEGKNQVEYAKLAQSLGIENRVKFLGFLENPFPYYKNALFTVLSSKNEGFPNVIIESLACETPVIAFDCFSGPNEIISHEKNGLLIENQNFNSLTKSMNMMIENKGLYQNCKENAKESVAKFDIEIIGNQWLQLIKNTVS